LQRSAANAGTGCQAEQVPTTAGTTSGPPPEAVVRVSTCLVELVLSAGEFGPQAEPALRQLRAALEAHQPVDESGTIMRTGMAVTQEFGKLDITLRALVSSGDLLQGALLGAEHLRLAVAALRDVAEPSGAAFTEQSVRASWS
jgi:hypothetical protein